MAERTCNGDELEDAQAALNPAVDGGQHHALRRGPQCKQVQCGESDRHNVSYCREDAQGTPAAFILSFVHSFVHLFIHSLAHSLTASFIQSFIPSFIHSFIHCLPLDTYIPE